MLISMNDLYREASIILCNERLYKESWIITLKAIDETESIHLLSHIVPTCADVI